MDDAMRLTNSAQMKVVGVGGGGSNAVDRMIEVGVQGIDFVALNTDSQALANSNAPVRMRIGDKVTRGLGCGGDPNLGEKAANESAEEITEILRGADMVFVTAGMGGGTGTGGAAVVAELARGLNALTVAVVTRPFSFEGSRRTKIANEGIERLREHVDTLIVIPNDRLLQVMGPTASIRDAFLKADDLLRQGIQGISEVIIDTGLINVDFNDVRSVMGNGGSALMAIGRGEGQTAAVDAAMLAVNNELLDVSIDGAKAVLYNIMGSSDMSMSAVTEAAEVIRQMVDPEANIIFGAGFDDTLGEQIRITLIAAGFDGRRASSAAVRAAARPEPDLGRTIEFPVKSFDKDDLDIPAFLRRNVTS